MHGMYTVEHSLWIGIARSLKLMAAPLVLRPVVPVLYDIINRNMTLAELSQCFLYLTRSLVALTTLPEAQHPLRIEGCLTCQCTITRNHVVEVLTGNEVVVHITSHLTPDAQLTTLFLTTRLCHTKTTIGLAAIRFPLDTQLSLLAFCQLGGKLIGIGVPGCTPTFRNDLLAVDIHLHVTRIVKNKLIELLLAFALATALRLDKAFVGDIGTLQVKTFGEILDAAIVCLNGYLRGGRETIFIIDGIFVTNQFLAILINIGTCQMTFFSLLVVKFESTIQLKIVIGITKTAVAVGIPQDTIVLIGEYERNRHLGIILEQVFVLALHIELLGLVLSESVESLIFRTVKFHLPLNTMLHGLSQLSTTLDAILTLRNCEILELLAVVRFLEQFFT